MSLSNLHSFHKRLRLQNATAFSGSHYLAIDNGTCVNARVVQLSRIQSARRVILAQEPMLSSSAPAPTLIHDTHARLTHEGSSIDFEMVPGEQLSGLPPLVMDDTADDVTGDIRGDVIHDTIHNETGTLAETITIPAPEPEAIAITEATDLKHLKMMDNQSDNARILALLEQQQIDRGPIRSRLMPELSTRRNAPQRKASRITWQPGRGTIEKVDKLTGEIVHLVELP